MKKIFALVLAMMLVLGMTSAMAVSIKINHADGYTPDTNTNPETYHYYKILDAVVPTDFELTDNDIETAKTSDTGFKYTIADDSPWRSAVVACGYFDISVQEGPDIVTLKEAYTANADTAKAIASALAAYTTDKDGTIDYDGSLTLDQASSVGSAGYYLIISSLGERLVLATTDMDITEKNTYPSIDKEEKDEDIDNFIDDGLTTHDAVNVAVGDTINYKVEVVVPATADKAITVTDEMSDGLTFDFGTSGSKTPFTVTSTGEIKDADWTVTSSSANRWVIQIEANEDTKGETITIAFDAVINSNAIADTNKKNEVTLDYSEFRQYDWVPYVMKVAGIHKYDGNTNENLENVEFELCKEDGTTKINVAYDETHNWYYPDENGTAVIKTDGYGKIIFRGLDGDKTYKLVETQPLTGYNALTGPVTLSLRDDTDELQVFDQVENNKGTQLPSTGGIGTTIFYVGGGILVLAAVILLVTKRRMSNND